MSELLTINRNAFILHYKSPFLDWINKVDQKLGIESKNFTIEEINEDSNIYLIEDFESNLDFKKWLSKNYTEIFVIILSEWILDDELWPKKLSYTLFNQFFDVKYYSMITDLVPDQFLDYD